MLTLTLKGLERDGMVTRTMFPTIPPRVDYELTDLGRSLSEPVLALGQWAQPHLEESKPPEPASISAGTPEMNAVTSSAPPRRPAIAPQPQPQAHSI